MEGKDKTLTGEESIRIISEMITKTQVNLRQGSFHLLLWGWLIFFCSLADWIAYRFLDIENSWLVWLLVIPGVFVSLGWGYIKGRKETVFTYATRIYIWTWISFLLAVMVLFAIQSDDMGSVAPYILLLAGVPTFISGVIIKFRPLIAGAACFWIFALLANFTGPQVSPLMTPLAMLTGYLIPGYMIKRKADNEQV